MPFCNILNDIEESGRLNFTLHIHFCQQLPFTVPNHRHSLPWPRENQAIDRAFYRTGFRIGKQSDKASSIEFFGEFAFPASQIVKGR